MVAHRRRLGVDRVDVRTLRSTRVEPPNRNAAGYISDGRGNVRIMAVPTVRGGATGQLGNRDRLIIYRTEGSRDWRSFGSFDSRPARAWCRSPSIPRSTPPMC